MTELDALEKVRQYFPYGEILDKQDFWEIPCGCRYGFYLGDAQINSGIHPLIVHDGDKYIVVKGKWIRSERKYYNTIEELVTMLHITEDV